MATTTTQEPPAPTTTSQARPGVWGELSGIAVSPVFGYEPAVMFPFAEGHPADPASSGERFTCEKSPRFSRIKNVLVEGAPLKAWITRWLAQYPLRKDGLITYLAGMTSFGHAELRDVYKWKYGYNYTQQYRALTGGPSAISNAATSRRTRMAFKMQSELGALRLLSEIPGAKGAAGASAILMAACPERYTVMDRRALNSLQYLGRWSLRAYGFEATFVSWLLYLDQCRSIADEVGGSLRDVDRALWAANGRA